MGNQRSSGIDRPVPFVVWRFRGRNYGVRGTSVAFKGARRRRVNPSDEPRRAGRGEYFVGAIRLVEDPTWRIKNRGITRSGVRHSDEGCPDKDGSRQKRLYFAVNSHIDPSEKVVQTFSLREH